MGCACWRWSGEVARIDQSFILLDQLGRLAGAVIPLGLAEPPGCFEVDGYSIVPLPVQLIGHIRSNLTPGLQALWGYLRGGDMARRRSYVSTFAQIQREAARAQAAQVRAQAAARREAERARTAYLRAQAANEKERKRLYAESRTAEVAAKNDDLEAEIAALQGLLAATLKVNDRISFSSLKKPAAVPPWRHPEPMPLSQS